LDLAAQPVNWYRFQFFGKPNKQEGYRVVSVGALAAGLEEKTGVLAPVWICLS
jgi:hypothetical protein